MLYRLARGCGPILIGHTVGTCVSRPFFLRLRPLPHPRTRVTTYIAFRSYFSRLRAVKSVLHGLSVILKYVIKAALWLGNPALHIIACRSSGNLFMRPSRNRSYRAERAINHHGKVYIVCTFNLSICTRTRVSMHVCTYTNVSVRKNCLNYIF